MSAWVGAVTVFGLGRLRPAPGTWGSLPPIAVAAALIACGFGPAQAPVVYHAVLAAILFAAVLACLVFGDRAEARFGDDPAEVVADETAGQCLPLMALPAASVATPMMAAFTLFWCFIAFRVLDVVKPWPANALQRLPGGPGIVLDDLAAGIQALIIVQVITRVML